MRTPRLLFLLALLFPAAVRGVAQYSIGKIEVRGAAPYGEAEVLQVIGLKPGQMLGQKSLAQATQLLVNTGLFDDAQVSLSGSGAARTVLVDLKPLPVATLAPAGFKNFVWWTPEELDAALRERVPLYRGGIPPAGNMPETIAAALTAMLKDKGIQGTVANAQVQPTDAHPRLSWQFSVDEPAVRIGAVSLRGIPPGLAPEMQRVASHIAGAPYNEGVAGDTIADMLLIPLRDAGYVDAQMTEAKREVSPSTGGYGVRYSATVVPGEPAHVGAVAWQATPVYSQESFGRESKLHAGDTASQKALLVTEQNIVNAYLQLGYLDAYVNAHPKEDAAAHTVNYALEVVPGEVYRVRTVSPLNLSPEARKDFDYGWLLKPGQPYNPLYTAGFLTNNTALRNLAHYTASFQATADPQTHLVDLTINFIRAGQ